MTSPVSHTIQAPGGGEIKIIAINDNIEYFVGTLPPDVVSGPVNFQVNVSGGSRRQYPGDATPIAVSGGTRRFLKDPSRRSGNALPGRPFVLQEITESGPGERRQFRIVGSVIALHAWLRSNIQIPVKFYTSRGASYEMLTPAE